MSRVFLTGDTHIPLDIHKLSPDFFVVGKDLTKDDYVVVLGDFGLLWSNVSDNEEKLWMSWLNKCPWTTLFIDGNHENMKRINSLPIEEKFGGNVGKVSDSIYHLRRGEIYTIGGKTFFCMGGASSIDRNSRIKDVEWWAEEVPSYSEFDHGIEKLKTYNNEVNYILTHTGPRFIIKQILLDDYGIHKVHNDATVDYFDMLLELPIKYDWWYFGHMHVDWDYNNDNISCLYVKIIEIEV
jgi:predicted phosphodiesterase